MASPMDDARQFISNLMDIPGRQAYFIEVPGTDSASALSVVSFKATEKMGSPSEVHIELTHPQQLARSDYPSPRSHRQAAGREEVA